MAKKTRLTRDTDPATLAREVLEIVKRASLDEQDKKFKPLRGDEARRLLEETAHALARNAAKGDAFYASVCRIVHSARSHSANNRSGYPRVNAAKE